MSVGFSSALVALKRAVALDADIAAGGTLVLFGWKSRRRQDIEGRGGANRLVFMPSADDAGSGGSFVPPKQPGDRDVLSDDGTQVIYRVRAIADVLEPAFLSVWARDASAPEDEEAQFEATTNLAEVAMRAIHGFRGGYASIAWGDRTWTVPETRSFGLELRIGFTLRSPVYFAPAPVVYPTAVAVTRGPALTTPDPVADVGDTRRSTT